MGISILFISHNLDLVAQICDRISVMYAGRIAESGDVEDVFDRPRHPYTRQLLRCIPRLDGGSGPMPTIPGLPPRFGVELPGCAFAPRCPVAQERCASETPPIQRERGQVSVCWEGVA
jgi:peptide/nickel transport system ATP-binding protein